MPSRFRLAIAQSNPTVGALESNAEKARLRHREARARGADMVALPELFISGYPPQDLVLKAAFTNDCMRHILALAERCAEGPALGIGGPLLRDGNLYNAYFILSKGEVKAEILKHHLPNHAVFDEARHFTPGPISGPFKIGEARIGTPICEDAWHEDICESLEESGADLLVVPNGSPYSRNKLERRHAVMVARVVETGLPLAYVNMTGGQDDLVFDGGSFVLNPGGSLALQMPQFEEEMAFVDFYESEEGWRAEPGDLASTGGEQEQDYRVMLTALREYLAKNGFSKVLLGLSGGVDSALVATLATDAIGPEQVRCVLLPSEFTSEESETDAREVARVLGCRLDEIPIDGPRHAVLAALAPVFRNLPENVAEENIQSRLRGLLLMAISNKFGEVLLTTGNKSEAAVGYATIYGDMAGGYNPIKDLYKTRVFDICRWRNSNHRPWMLGPEGAVVPRNVLEKPPTAELRANQKDSDSLPEYETLDGILEMLIDEDKSVDDVERMGYDREMVKRVEQLVYSSEYKRFQSAPGARLTGRALWLDRRYPIVNKWRDEESVASDAERGSL
ncbi:MAG: NAD+ synthase [Albidovulum sp.]|nr:NAD+ synthase [Albidovulum sp.]